MHWPTTDMQLMPSYGKRRDCSPQRGAFEGCHVSQDCSGSSSGRRSPSACSVSSIPSTNESVTFPSWAHGHRGDITPTQGVRGSSLSHWHGVGPVPPSPLGTFRARGGCGVDIAGVLQACCPCGIDAGPSKSEYSQDVGHKEGTGTQNVHLPRRCQRMRGRRTLVFQRIPREYSRDMVVEMLHEHGFAGKFDFLYLPCNFANGRSFGYFFVNMISSANADDCMRYFNGFMDWRVASDNVCAVLWADTDGLQANIQRYRNSPVMHPSVPSELQPILFGSKGVQIGFPAATRKLKAPKTLRLLGAGQAVRPGC